MGTKLLEKRIEEIEMRLRALEERFEKRGKKIGLSIEEVKGQLMKPQRKLRQKEIKKAKSIIGIWKNGPADLSAHFREYLRGDRKWK